MKLTITKAEVDALIRGSFDLPSDAEVEIVDNEYSGQDADGWTINTQTKPIPPHALDRRELIDIVYNTGYVYRGCQAIGNLGSWNVNNAIHIVKYRKHCG